MYLPQTKWNHAKNSMKQLKRPTSLIYHWFSVEMVHNGQKLCKRIFLRLEFFWGIQGIPCESWRPELYKYVMVFYAAILKTQVMAAPPRDGWLTSLEVSFMRCFFFKHCEKHWGWCFFKTSLKHRIIKSKKCDVLQDVFRF